jgi:hypothetical protein
VHDQALSATVAAVATTTLRPLGIGEVLDGAIKVVTRHWRVMVACMAGIVVPLVVIGVLIQASVDPEKLRLSVQAATESGNDSNPQLLGGSAALSIVLWVAFLVANLTSYRAAGDAWAGEPPTAASSLRQGLRRVLPYLGMELIVVVVFVVLVAVAFALGPLGVLPGLVVVWLWPFAQIAQPIVVLERVGPIKALSRSVALLRDGWWRTFLTLVLAFLLLVIAFLIIGLALGLTLGAAAGDGEVSGAIARVVINTLALSVALPFATATNTIVYYDRRVRREGLDLQLQSAAPRWEPPSPDDHVFAPEPRQPEPEPDRGRADWLPPEAPRGPGGL